LGGRRIAALFEVYRRKGRRGREKERRRGKQQNPRREGEKTRGIFLMLKLGPRDHHR